ncbi:MAG: glycosyltransferase [Isosphaeraceae bacterium]|nr:glycosyltransferase [Isosphaeraceae bacterium]
MPVHNQADHVESVVVGYEAALARVGCPHELVLVTNACRDESPSICRDLARHFQSVRAIDSTPGGWGLAVKLGLRESRGNWLAYTNSARTPPDQLAAIVQEALRRPGTVVKARRRARTPLRKLGSSLYNWEGRLLFGIAGGDVNGTPKVFPRHFSGLLSLTRDDDLIDLEFMVVCRREGYPVVEVPVRSGQRHGGESTTRLKSALMLYAGAYRLWSEWRE